MLWLDCAHEEDAKTTYEKKPEKQLTEEHFMSIARKTTGTDSWCSELVVEESYRAGGWNTTAHKSLSGPLIATVSPSRGRIELLHQHGSQGGSLERRP